ncbi:hypothetical protein HHI36_012717 [Cryptolaemus montrouzieri]|uniref:Uncharacterized protein n=1 Tax=Cryptolaemus montrouzieri TaxID=559131 RepID=A0ABD2NG24_9CUCU
MDIRKLSCLICAISSKCNHYSLGLYHIEQANQQVYVPLIQLTKRFGQSVQGESSCKPKPKDYVVVQFCGKKSITHYVGVIEANFSDEFYIRFLRKSNTTNFHFQTQDVSVVKIRDSVRVLPAPLINKSDQYIFSADLSLFHNLC